MSPPQESNNAPCVAVVGAGLAGLATAWELRRLGCRARVFEAREHPGGRRRGEWVDGFYLEQTLDALRTSDADLIAWIRDSGAGDDLLPLRPVLDAHARIAEVRTMDTTSVRGLSRIPGVRRLEAMRVLRLPRLMRRYRPQLDLMRPELAADLDFRSVADFARLYFGDSVLEHWIGPVSQAVALGDPLELSRVVFLLDYEHRQQGRAGLARRGFSHALATAAERSDLRTGAKVGAVDADAQSSSGSLRVHPVAGGSALEVDAVVLATGATEALRLALTLATPAERDFLSQLRFVATAVLSVALDRPLAGVPQHLRIPDGERSPLAGLLSEPGGADGRAPQGCGIVTAVATARFAEACIGSGDDIVEKEMRAAVERIYPRAVIRFTRMIRTEADVPAFDVGAYRALDRFRRVQRDRRACGRRLYFAGDYLGGVGAAQTFATGLRAARQVAADLIG